MRDCVRQTAASQKYLLGQTRNTKFLGGKDRPQPHPSFFFKEKLLYSFFFFTPASVTFTGISGGGGGGVVTFNVSASLRLITADQTAPAAIRSALNSGLGRRAADRDAHTRHSHILTGVCFSGLKGDEWLTASVTSCGTRAHAQPTHTHKHTKETLTIDDTFFFFFGFSSSFAGTSI